VKANASDGLDVRRTKRLLDFIARMAGGDLRTRAPISPRHDTIDALAFGLNLLGGELHYTLEGLRRAREEAEHATAAKEIFLRNVTHELRTPITVLLLISEQLRAPTISTERRQRLGDRMERSCRTLLRLVDHVLDLSRLEAQRLELLVEAVSPEALIREAVDMLELEASRKSVDVNVKVARNALPIVLSDATRLRQVLLNVLGNAVKYTDKGKVQVRLATDAKRNAVSVEVTDTGAGITEEDRKRLFEPFARGKATAHRYPGNGLGLALSRRLCRVLGGDLTLVRSTPGRGSRFRITLPAPPRAATAQTRNPQRVPNLPR
jgi:signal transduction histidine kinase